MIEKTHVNQPSPDLFESDSFIEKMDEKNGNDLMAQDEKDDQCDVNEVMDNDNVPLETPLAPSEQATTPPNPFSTLRDLCSEGTKNQIGGIILALNSQTQQISPIQQQQEPQQEQTQPENDLPSISFENLTVEEMIEQVSSSFERMKKSIDEVKKS